MRKIDYFVLFQKWQDLSFVITNLNKKKNGDLLEAKEKVKSGPCGPAYITLILHRNKKKQGLVLDKLYTRYTISTLDQDIGVFVKGSNPVYEGGNDSTMWISFFNVSMKCCQLKRSLKSPT